jgi:L-glutamine-phosphate cytidylyltransferase
MKGVILAAGRGARLNGDDNELPKCLVRVGSETMLARNVRLLRDAGHRDLVVVVGCGAEAVRRSCPGVTFVENTRFAQTNSLYSLWLAAPHLVGGFVVMNCDVIVHPRLVDDLLTARHEDALLVDYRQPDTTYSDEEMKVRVRGGRVIDLSKTMADDEADGENLGVVKFGPEGARLLMEEMEALVAAGVYHAWAPQAFARVAARRPLHAIGTRGLPWIEVDFPEDYRRAIDVVLPEIERDASVAAVPAPRIARTA